MRYVVGFVFDKPRYNVILIEKRRPTWQAGKLNGIGGHIEPGETALGAMVREAREEAGLVTLPAEWRMVAYLMFPTGSVHFFDLASNDHYVAARTMTDEPVVRADVPLQWPNRVIANLNFLIPLCVYAGADASGSKLILPVALCEGLA